MGEDKKLKYRIAIKYESNHPIEASSAEEAVRAWQKEFHLEHMPYQIREQEWIKGGYRVVVELQEHLKQGERDALGESISISNIDKAGKDIS